MTAAPHQATPAAGKRRIPPGALKAYVASLTGTSLEYYDFAIYSVASALVFPKVFFPGNDEYVGLLLSFSTFAVGYLARPIGGVIFGRLGDKIGRKHVLVTTLLLIGIATVLIGVLPGLRHHRHGRTHHPGAAAPGAGNRRRRRMGRRRAALERIRRRHAGAASGLPPRRSARPPAT